MEITVAKDELSYSCISRITMVTQYVYGQVGAKMVISKFLRVNAIDKYYSFSLPQAHSYYLQE